MDRSDFARARDAVGLRGVLKSVYWSRRATGRLDRFLLHPSVITRISPQAEFDMDGRLGMGYGTNEASSPALGRSRLTITEDATLDITTEDHAFYMGPCSSLHVSGRFAAGNANINAHGRVICHEEISIGDGTQIAWNITLLDADTHHLIVDGERRPNTAPIRIGERCWIGHDVTVKKGVEIGDGAVIASDSVVTKDIPANALAAGVPAEVKREDVDWEA